MTAEERAFRAQLRAQERMMRAQLEAQRDANRTALKMARVRARRDLLASAAQASATNPMWSNIAAGVLGATMATVGGLATTVKVEAANELDRRGRSRLAQALRAPLTSRGSTFGQSPLETAGEGMMLLAGGKQAAHTVAEFISAIRGQSVGGASLAFDIADGGDAGLPPIPSAPAGVPFSAWGAGVPVGAYPELAPQLAQGQRVALLGYNAQGVPVYAQEGLSVPQEALIGAGQGATVGQPGRAPPVPFNVGDIGLPPQQGAAPPPVNVNVPGQGYGPAVASGAIAAGGSVALGAAAKKLSDAADRRAERKAATAERAASPARSSVGAQRGHVSAGTSGGPAGLAESGGAARGRQLIKEQGVTRKTPRAKLLNAWDAAQEVFSSAVTYPMRRALGGDYGGRGRGGVQ